MENHTPPFVSIITVSYKDDPYLANFISSIEKLVYPKTALEVIVVSILSSKKIVSKKVTLKQVMISKSVGYAEAVNTGIGHSKGDYIFLPNPDVIIEKFALQHLIAYLIEYQDVGVVGPKTYLLDNPKEISIHDLPTTKFNRITGKLVPAEKHLLNKMVQPQEFYLLCGNAIMLKKSVWDEVGKYDESYFLYWEDTDFNMRIRRLGYKSVMIPAAKLFHKGSGSIGNTPRQVYYAVRNGRYFLNKYSFLSAKILLHLSNILLIISKNVQIKLLHMKQEHNQAFLNGIIDFYKGKRGAYPKDK